MTRNGKLTHQPRQGQVYPISCEFSLVFSTHLKGNPNNRYLFESGTWAGASRKVPGNRQIITFGKNNKPGGKMTVFRYIQGNGLHAVVGNPNSIP